MRQSGRDVDFDTDIIRVDSEDGGRADGGEHDADATPLGLRAIIFRLRAASDCRGAGAWNGLSIQTIWLDKLIRPIVASRHATAIRRGPGFPRLSADLFRLPS